MTDIKQQYDPTDVGFLRDLDNLIGYFINFLSKALGFLGKYINEETIGFSPLLIFVFVLIGIFTGTMDIMWMFISMAIGLIFFAVFLSVPFLLAIKSDEDLDFFSDMGLEGIKGKIAVLFFSGLMFASVGTIGVPSSVDFLHPFMCPEGYAIQPQVETRQYDMPGIVISTSYMPVCVKEIQAESGTTYTDEFYPDPGIIMGLITFFFMFYSMILLVIGYTVNHFTLPKYKNIRYLMTPIVFLFLFFEILIDPAFIMAMANAVDMILNYPIG